MKRLKKYSQHNIRSKTEIKLLQQVRLRKKKCVERWELLHNLPEIPGLSIMDAFENWSARTSNPTINDFIDYVVSKDPTFICMKKSDLKDNPRNWNHRHNINNV